MIRLDFELIHSLGYILPDEVPHVREGDIATELFQCYLSFEVNGCDLSWRVSIPMVDFSRSMFLAANGLGPECTEAGFSSAEYITRWTFRLSASRVSISRDDFPVEGESEHAELLTATAHFGVRVFDSLIEAVPGAKDNAFLTHWYPYDEMKRRLRGSS